MAPVVIFKYLQPLLIDREQQASPGTEIRQDLSTGSHIYLSLARKPQATFVESARIP